MAIQPLPRPTFDLTDALGLLERTPATFEALLGGLPESWGSRPPAKDAWSPYEVLCHLVYIETDDWPARFRIVLDEGEARPFDPVDHGSQIERFVGWSMARLLHRFAELRAANLAEVRSRNLSSADLERRGRHPTLGPVTLTNLMAAWVVHDLNHLAQATTALAHRHSEDVGPWLGFLGILNREP